MVVTSLMFTLSGRLFAGPSAALNVIAKLLGLPHPAALPPLATMYICVSSVGLPQPEKSAIVNSPLTSVMTGSLHAKAEPGLVPALKTVTPDPQIGLCPPYSEPLIGLLTAPEAPPTGLPPPPPQPPTTSIITRKKILPRACIARSSLHRLF